MRREISDLYAAFSGGGGLALPELPIRYGDYAAWQRDRAASEPEREEQISYWKRELDTESSVLDLPLTGCGRGCRVIVEGRFGLS